MTDPRFFAPELIVEATALCDRACAGCYAPNVVSVSDSNLWMSSNPELFLAEDALRAQLASIFKERGKLLAISFRGGEPSLHPCLPKLLAVASQYAERVYLETHGRWIPTGEMKAGRERDLLYTCMKYGVIVKVSHDRMHGLTPLQLEEITKTLTCHSLFWLVAITEPSVEEFQRVRRECHWIPESRVIFQRKASSAGELLEPSLGVIRPNGKLSKSLSSRRSFEARAEALP